MSSRRSYQEPHRVNLWKIPLLLSIAAVAIFLVTYHIDRLDNAGTISLPGWLHFGGIDDCRALLGALMGAVSTVLALIFSVALLVISMVATLFGPRLLYRFVQDRVTQTTIGLFMATFVYLLLAFLVEQQEGKILFVPQLTTMCSWFFTLVSFSALVYYSHRIAVSIQNPDMIANIVDDFDAAIVADSRLARGEGPPPPADEVQRQHADGARFPCGQSGYLQHIDHPALVEAARRAGACVHIPVRPGQYVLRGEALAHVWPASSLDALREVLARAIQVGRHRVLDQDVVFGILQIVEIAIRALSPAVNDTFTGVACVDCLGDALASVLHCPPASGNWYDADGGLRVRHPAVTFRELVGAAFNNIRQASADTPAVTIRMLSIIARLAPLTRDDTERGALLEQADAIRETAASGRTVAYDRTHVEQAWTAARAALTGRSAPE